MLRAIDRHPPQSLVVQPMMHGAQELRRVAPAIGRKVCSAEGFSVAAANHARRQMHLSPLLLELDVVDLEASRPDARFGWPFG